MCKKSILIADDEKMITESLAYVLQSEGYRVIKVSNGLEALQVIKDTGGVDFLITDVYMPEMDGIELVAAIREQNLPIDIIAISGGDFQGTQSWQAPENDNYIKTIEKYARTVFVRKPFRINEILRVLHGLHGTEGEQ